MIGRKNRQPEHVYSVQHYSYCTTSVLSYHTVLLLYSCRVVYTLRIYSYKHVSYDSAVRELYYQ